MKHYQTSRTLLFSSIVSLLIVACATTRTESVVPKTLRGDWRSDATGTTLLHITADEVLYSEAGSVVRLGIVAHAGSSYTFRKFGRLEHWSFAVDRSTMTAIVDGQPYVYSRLSEPPAVFAPHLIAIAPTHAVSDQTVEFVQQEVARRMNIDQAVRKDPAQRARSVEVAKDNQDYVVHVLATIGWPSKDRFGTKTAYDFTILAKHTEYIAVLQAVLPYVAHDFASAGDYSQAFAIIYDELSLKLGGMQRFGSQVCVDSAKQPFVCALEQPEKVNDRRAALGMGSLEQYLQQVSKVLFQNRAIKMPSASDAQ